MSNFTFPHSEWADIFEAATRAESLAYPDPRTACFYARRAHLAGLDALFAPLQHRAFNGEL